MEVIRKIKINGEERELVADITKEERLAIAQDVAERIALEAGDNTFVKQYSYDDEGNTCYDLIIGQEYRLVYNSSYDGYAYVNIGVSPDGWSSLGSRIPNEPDGTTNHHTLKVLGLENAVVSLEYDGVIYTEDYTNYGYEPSKLSLVGAKLVEWHGELYLVNDSGLNTRQQLERLNAKAEELESELARKAGEIETTIGELDAKIDDVDAFKSDIVLAEDGKTLIEQKPYDYNPANSDIEGGIYEYNIEFGKEYRVEITNSTKNLLYVHIDVDHEWDMIELPRRTPYFTFKIISCENSITTYEYNGVRYSKNINVGISVSSNRAILCSNDIVYAVSDSQFTIQDVDTLKSILLNPVEGVFNDPVGYDFANLEVGKEYRAVCTNATSPTEHFSLKVSMAEGVGMEEFTYYPIGFAVGKSHCLSFKIIGVEDSTLTFEHNGVRYTVYCGDYTNIPLNVITNICLEHWQGELYEVFDPTATQQRIEEVHKDLKESLTITTLIPIEGKTCEYGGLVFENLEVGKEYKAVCETPEFPDMAYGLYASPVGVKMSYGLIIKSVGDSRTLTFKVLGIENSIIYFEWNGEIKTRDLSDERDYINAPSNALEDIEFGGWQGELYEVSSEAFDPSAMQQKIEEVHETLKADVEALQETLNSLERAEDWVL